MFKCTSVTLQNWSLSHLSEWGSKFSKIWLWHGSTNPRKCDNLDWDSAKLEFLVRPRTFLATNSQNCTFWSYMVYNLTFYVRYGAKDSQNCTFWSYMGYNLTFYVRYGAKDSQNCTFLGQQIQQNVKIK